MDLSCEGYYVVRGKEAGENYFTEICSASEAGSYLTLIDFGYHSTLGLNVIKEIKRPVPRVRIPPHLPTHCMSPTPWG